MAFTDKTNQRIATFVVPVVLILGVFIYFGFGYGFFVEITDKDYQYLSKLTSRMPELEKTMDSIQEDGKITQVEYWDVVDEYNERKQEEYKRKYGL